jgi:hypothetical protein
MDGTADLDRRSFLEKGMKELLGGDPSILETGEKVSLLSVDGFVVEVDKAYLKPVPDLPVTPEESRKGIPGKSFVMVIDLSRCKCKEMSNRVQHDAHGRRRPELDQSAFHAGRRKHCPLLAAHDMHALR